MGSNVTGCYAGGANSVTLADSGGEGTPPNYMGPMHLAQTAGYGVLPGPPGSGMENTFLAQVCTHMRTDTRARIWFNCARTLSLTHVRTLVWAHAYGRRPTMYVHVMLLGVLFCCEHVSILPQTTKEGYT
jgi:hypothetical protein